MEASSSSKDFNFCYPLVVTGLMITFEAFYQTDTQTDKPVGE